jgi:hypothetical protein
MNVWLMNLVGWTNKVGLRRSVFQEFKKLWKGSVYSSRIAKLLEMIWLIGNRGMTGAEVGKLL